MAERGDAGSGLRASAASLLREVAAGRSLSAVLPQAQARVAPRDRALLQELAYGTLRWHPRLEALATSMLKRPFKARDADVHMLLLVGLYQLLYTDIPAHAAVAATVGATATLRKPWARGLLNGVLRRLQRERESLLAAVDADAAARWGQPQWLLEQWRQAWPDDWEAIATGANGRPPMTLRVNRRHGTAAEYAARLAGAGFTCRPGRHGTEALTLDRPVPVERLPGFADGAVSVQDEAAQLAAPLLEPSAGLRVLDACAAPGGKTAHLLELCPGCEVTALDRDAARAERIGENLRRLSLEARVVVGDAGEPAEWWGGIAFDRILLDAPCSATGVIRRHPDIKLLRRPDDIAALAREQARLLDALWPLLRPGGMLVYATCSILPQENSEQISGFLNRCHDAREVTPRAAWGRGVDPGRQILPGEEGMDGFYYARLRKG